MELKNKKILQRNNMQTVKSPLNTISTVLIEDSYILNFQEYFLTGNRPLTFTYHSIHCQKRGKRRELSSYIFYLGLSQLQLIFFPISCLVRRSNVFIQYLELIRWHSVSDDSEVTRN